MSDLRVSAAIKVYERGNEEVSYTLEKDLNGEVSLKDIMAYTKRALISTAKTVLQEELANGFDPGYLTVVDNSKNKPLESVSPLGKIQFIARQAASDVLTKLYKLILEKSPVDTGLYRDSHLVFVNGAIVARNLQQLEAFLKSGEPMPPGTVIRFVNIMPYAGKLERQGVVAGNSKGKQRLGQSSSKKKKAAGIKVRLPNGAYFLALKEFRATSGRNVKSNFEFYNGKSLGIPGAVGAPAVGRRGNKLRYDSARPKPRPYAYPTIRIVLEEGGVL